MSSIETDSKIIENVDSRDPLAYIHFHSQLIDTAVDVHLLIIFQALFNIE